MVSKLNSLNVRGFPVLIMIEFNANGNNNCIVRTFVIVLIKQSCGNENGLGKILLTLSVQIGYTKVLTSGVQKLKLILSGCQDTANFEP
jgi:hypothetical protein